MTLAQGSRLGPYEILAPVGLGAPKPLFKLSVPPKGTGAEIYPTADHRRFLVLDHGQKANALLNLVVNWTAVAKR